MRDVALFIMKQKVILFDSGSAEINHFRRQSVHANSLIAIPAEDQRLSLFKFDRGVSMSGFVVGITERSCVKYVAVLIDLHKRRPFVCSGSLQCGCEVPDIGINGPGNKRGAGTKSQPHGIQWMIDCPHRSAFRNLPFNAGWRVLSFSQTINSIIEQKIIDIQIASHDMHKVVTTDTQTVSIPCDDPYDEIRSGNLEPRGNGGRTTMNRMDSTGVDVIREPAGTSDA
jgi:hypothetical protein